ncbi:acetyltransferase domain-containing protein [Nemania sp. FL0916]|nr:acetyltransferase domain-containing protein [Nemania sp. FL0916]
MVSQSTVELAPAPVPPPPARDSSSTIRVKTTWPVIPANIDRAPIRTERLLLRPFTATDAEAAFELRRQPEVMFWTVRGTPDEDVAESRAWIERFLPPRDLETFEFVILQQHLADADVGANANVNTAAKSSAYDDLEGTLIGMAGAHIVVPEQGWPEIGYLFRKETWGRGYGTEFLRAFVEAWWRLPRREIELDVDVESVVGLGVGKRDRSGAGNEEEGDVCEVVPEVLTAVIEVSNIGSRRVLEKAGFREYKTWNAPNTHVGSEGDVTLVAFGLEAPSS